MIYTEEVFAIEDQLNELIKKITEGYTMEKLISSKIAMEKSEDVQRKINSFSAAKRVFEDIEAYGKHAPDYTEKRRAVRQEKRHIDTDPLIMKFRRNENDLQEILDTISYRLAQAVSPDIKIDAGNPFFEFAQRGCGGSCHVGK